MSADFPDRVAAVGGDAASKGGLAIADSNDALRVPVPGDVVQTSGKDGEFAKLSVNVVGFPNVDKAVCVTTGDFDSVG